MTNGPYTLTRWVTRQTLQPMQPLGLPWWVRLLGAARRGLPSILRHWNHHETWWQVNWHPDGLGGHAVPIWPIRGNWQLRFTRMPNGDWQIISWYDPIGLGGWLTGWFHLIEFKWMLRYTLTLIPPTPHLGPPTG